MLRKNPTIYILANKPFGTIYIGVTSDLIKRIYEHKEGLVPGFTQKYGCKILVYYEQFESMIDAMEREKQIKAGSRIKKIALIKNINPKWDDLYNSLI